MTIEVLTGTAAEQAGSESEFKGFSSPRRFAISEGLVDKASTLLENAIAGKWGADKALAEAFSTSDFKLAAFATIDKEMLAQYNELPETWRSYTTVTTVNDFRPKRLLDRWRNTVGLELVPELKEYPAEDDRGSADYSIEVRKFGRRFALSWESWINNEAIQELEDLPTVLARQSRETEAINAVTNLIKADRTGVNTDFFKAGNGNAPTALPLTLDNLDLVLGQMALKNGNSDKPIATPSLIVVIPKSLERTAQRIKATRLIRKIEASQETEYDNYLADVEFVVDPFLDYFNQHAKAATTWFVLPKPGQGRPALWAAFLRGYETPDLRVKADTGTTLSGGNISPLEGSFEVDDIQYRARHIVGHQVGDPLFTYVSLGS